MTATIHMKSNITLYVESGAVLRFSDRFEDYLPFVKIRWEGTVMNTLSPLIYAHDAENLTITGVEHWTVMDLNGGAGRKKHGN
ncbi:hypothetical protein BFINE_02670 [Bacteroides finegoldii DSM 17565]|nr:hypothetical protein BFINE_02670 [Bacteroides finegoldii DSM 17565]